MDLPSISEQADHPYVSTGHLPEPEMVQRLVSDAHQRFQSNGDGHNSQVYPALARAPRALTVMITAGLYETSGDWLYDIGLPGKSGIGGGIVEVSPGKGSFGTFAPPIDAAGNSVKGQLAAKFLSQRLGMDLFVSQPED